MKSLRFSVCKWHYCLTFGSFGIGWRCHNWTAGSIAGRFFCALEIIEEVKDEQKD